MYYVDGIRCDTAEEARRLRDSRRESAPQTFEPTGRDAFSVPGHPPGCTCNRCENYRLPLHY